MAKKATQQAAKKQPLGKRVAGVPVIARQSAARSVRRAQGAPSSLACVVLAAGQGTRMRSARAKVLHQVLGRPMAAYPIELARELRAAPVVAVLGHERAAVQTALDAHFGAGAVIIAEQTEQRGTGHALRMALPALKTAKGILLVLYGDVPLLRRETLSALVATARRTGRLALVTTTPPDPTGYGRIVRDARGLITGVVEQKDATEAERAIGEVNAGIYAGPIDFFRHAIPRLATRNAAGEYYLTDIVAAAAKTIGVRAVSADFRDVSGVNDRRQLIEAETIMRDRVNGRWSLEATLRDPESTIIEPDVVLESDVEIGRNVTLRGKTRIGRGTRVGDGSILVDTTVGAEVEIRPYTVATEAVIGDGAVLGPFAHLRPGTELGEGAHVGNFVELKKTKLGRGSKANHLTYLGDAVIGSKVNIGAGTITCNYNGYEKTQTVIEDGAFIGSDSQLVAPVRIGSRAVVAAGTTVTEDIPPGALAIGRVAQAAVPGYADRVAARYASRGGTPAAKPAVRSTTSQRAASPSPSRKS